MSPTSLPIVQVKKKVPEYYRIRGARSYNGNRSPGTALTNWQGVPWLWKLEELEKQGKY